LIIKLFIHPVENLNPFITHSGRLRDNPYLEEWHFPHRLKNE
jgi:hypothetical protein